jgi:hypothetical protein
MQVDEVGHGLDTLLTAARACTGDVHKLLECPIRTNSMFL